MERSGIVAVLSVSDIVISENRLAKLESTYACSKALK